MSLEVPQLGFGGAPIGGFMGAVDEAAALDELRRACDGKAIGIAADMSCNPVFQTV